MFPCFQPCARYEPFELTPKPCHFVPWNDKSTQSYSGELGTVQEPHTFITWVFVSQPWFCDIQLFPKISVNVVKSPWGRGSWYRNMTGEISLRWGKVEGGKGSNEQCNHNAENIWGRSWRKGFVNKNFLQVKSWCDSLSRPRQTMRLCMFHGDPKDFG